MLVAEVERIELAAELQARAADVAGGLAPVWARRSLFPHEIAARTSFAAMADRIDIAASNVGRRLAQDRQQMTALIGDWLADAPNAAVVAARLSQLQARGILTVPGAGQVIDATERALRAELERLALSGASAAVSEALSQGVEIGAPVALDEVARAQIDEAARRLAVAPHVELVQAMQLEASRLGALPVPELLGRLEGAGAAMSQGPLDLGARNAISGADGIGRQAVAVNNPQGRQPARVYASEILDGNTCGPCSLVDGREYSSVGEARVDYPAGIYRACDGGPRCRGTLVFVWEEEALPTLPAPAR